MVQHPQIILKSHEAKIFSMFLYEKHTLLLEESEMIKKRKRKKGPVETKPSPDVIAAVFLNQCVSAAPCPNHLLNHREAYSAIKREGK